MSDQTPFDTSRPYVTADEFKKELDSVLEYVELASESFNLPTPNEMFVDAGANRHWLLCYAIRFAARCASHCVTHMRAEGAEGPGAKDDSRRWH